MVGRTPDWDPTKCALAFPSSSDPERGAKELDASYRSIFDGSYGKPRPTPEEFIGNPTPANASATERMREMLSDGRRLCAYGEPLRGGRLVHLRADARVRSAFSHFYAFLLFADWRQDLHSKRLVRDHLRYSDEIQCAAARVVEAVRARARGRDPGNPGGHYDAMHARRGDFGRQYGSTQLSAEEMYARSEGALTRGSTLFVATDEEDRRFFEVFGRRHDVVFLEDFRHVILDLNPNYFGMIDQLVASKARTFFGTYRSTFSGYINRLRGYHAAKDNPGGYEDKQLNSWYFSPKSRMGAMMTYHPVRGRASFEREYPVCWRDIDRGIDESPPYATPHG